jgi:hypothetical protein
MAFIGQFYTSIHALWWPSLDSSTLASTHCDGLPKYVMNSRKGTNKQVLILFTTLPLLKATKLKCLTWTKKLCRLNTGIEGLFESCTNELRAVENHLNCHTFLSIEMYFFLIPFSTNAKCVDILSVELGLGYILSANLVKGILSLSILVKVIFSLLTWFRVYSLC